MIYFSINDTLQVVILRAVAFQKNDNKQEYDV